MGKAIEQAVHWVIAAALAALIAWMFVRVHTANNTPCNEQRCVAEIEKRISVLDARMRVMTEDRYTGSDAKRDLIIINKRIDALHENIHGVQP